MTQRVGSLLFLGLTLTGACSSDAATSDAAEDETASVEQPIILTSFYDSDGLDPFQNGCLWGYGLNNCKNPLFETATLVDWDRCTGPTTMHEAYVTLGGGPPLAAGACGDTKRSTDVDCDGECKNKWGSPQAKGTCQQGFTPCWGTSTRPAYCYCQAPP